MEASLTLVETLDDALAFRTWLGERRPWLGVDTETGGLDWYREPLRLVQVGDANAGWAFAWDDWAGVLKETMPRYDGPMALHNAKFDLHFMEDNGLHLDRRHVYDTMRMVGLVEPTRSAALKSAAVRHIDPGAAAGERLLRKAMAKNRWTWATVPVDLPEYWAYGALDPVLTSRLAEIFYPQIISQGLDRAFAVECDLVKILCDMEKAGMRVDIEYTTQKRDQLLDAEHAMERWFDDLGISNPRSDAKIITWFQSQGYVFRSMTEKGNISLDSTVLTEIARERPDLAVVANAVESYRDYGKMRKTYFDSYLEFADDEDRVHSHINTMGARTGRMSSQRPNLQNVPARRHGKLVRDCFIPAPGHKLIAADFDQIEYRIMIARAGEEMLVDAINEGRDLHSYMASVVWDRPMESITPDERSLMKNATFAFLYGAGDAKFSVMAGISVKEAKAFREMYQQRFPAIAKYAHTITSYGRAKGEIQTEYLGRKQAVDDPNKAYKLLNYVTQGEAGDVLKVSMTQLANTEVGPFMRLPIHDELLFEVPEDQVEMAVETIQQVMPENDYYSVPLSVGVDVVDRWGDKYAAE